MRKLRIEVRGPRGDYWRYTVLQWCLEVKEILEQELGVEIEISERDGEEIAVLVEGEEAFSGVPGEEGYLLELLKSKIERMLGR